MNDDSVLQALVDKATHMPPARYSRGKHWKGRTDQERRESSQNDGPSQFVLSMTAARVRELERETLLTGDVVDRGAGNYHAFKQFAEQIGWANGEEAYWLRAELSSGTIHSHPRLGKG